MGWCDGVRALHRADIGSEGIHCIQLIYDYCCDKGSDIAMACGRWKGNGKDKAGGERGREMSLTCRPGAPPPPLASVPDANSIHSASEPDSWVSGKVRQSFEYMVKFLISSYVSITSNQNM
jgi:hypothetical protein